MTEKDRVREPVQDRSRDKKHSLTETGKKLFALKGYQGTNTKEIAREAGVSVGTFYAYFTDKGDLFREIVEGYYEEIFRHSREMMAREFRSEGDLDKIIPGLVRTLYEAHAIEPALHREISIILLQGSNHEGPEGPDQKVFTAILRKVEALDGAVQAWVEELLRHLLPDGPDETLAAAACLIFRTTEETVHRLRQFPDSMENPDAVLNQLALMLGAYLDRLRQKPLLPK
jgi:AcrR family transcriptional regulator